MTAPKQDPRWRRAERIRERVLELLRSDLHVWGEVVHGMGPRSLEMAMVALFPGAAPTLPETRRALCVLRRAGKVRYDGPRRVWRLA